jgi:hypothetical protein
MSRSLSLLPLRRHSLPVITPSNVITGLVPVIPILWSAALV